MKMFIVMEDLGDGDVALRYFQDADEAQQYIDANPDWCYYESNPHFLDTDKMKFQDA